MAERKDWGSVGLDVNAGEGTEAREINADSPFRMLLVGDFSGRANRGIRTPAHRAVQVDRDTYAQVMASLGTAVELPVIGRIEFRQYDDFLPDRLYQRLKAFHVLREQRDRLSDPDQYRSAAEDMRRIAEPPRTLREEDTVRAVSSSLLDAAIERTESAATGAAPSRHADPFAAMLRDLVAPYAVPKPDARQVELIAQIDKATQEVMRAILHHPAFQAIEAAWRALDQLVKAAETGERLKIYIADLSQQEVADDLNQAADLKQTRLHGLLKGKGYAVAGLNLSLGLNLTDLSVLGRLALLGRMVETPMLAHGQSSLVGCPSWTKNADPDDWEVPAATEEWEMWQAIRGFPEAACIGLVSPRFLLRMPYGKEFETTERIEFEEMDELPKHEWYLWGNPVFACLELMAAAFTEEGWSFHPDGYRQIHKLPMHSYVVHGETVITPVAEAILTDQAGERILSRGLMPLLSEKNGNSALLRRWQSIREPITALAGRWRH
jgi:type VI secretion system protein ImpC